MSPHKESSADYLASLETKYVGQLTSLLTLSPNLSIASSYYHTSQTTQISKLSSSLLRSRSIFSSLKKHLHLTTDHATLCPTHSALDPKLIHALTVVVQAEVSEHVLRFESRPAFFPEFSQTVNAFTERMRAVNGLWTSSETFAIQYGENWKYAQPENGCDACVLSFIGGNSQILTDLKASIIGRRKTRKDWPRLTRFIDAWIEGLGENETGKFNTKSDVLGSELRDLRKHMRSDRQRRHSVAETKTKERKYHGRSKSSVEPMPRLHISDLSGTTFHRCCSCTCAGSNPVAEDSVLSRRQDDSFGGSIQYTTTNKSSAVRNEAVPAARPAFQDDSFTGSSGGRSYISDGIGGSRSSCTYSDSLYSQDNEVPFSEVNR